MSEDFNQLERVAQSLRIAGRYKDALKIYFYMAAGDPSLDGGGLGYKIGQCYESLNDYDAAHYWFNRAKDENPTIPEFQAASARYVKSIDEVRNLVMQFG